MSPERTLSIAHVDAEPGFSGGEVQVFLLMEGLGKRGHRNVLVVPPGSQSEREGRARGLEVHAVPMRSALDVPAVLRLARVFARARVDLAHLHTGRATWLGAWAARFARRPAVSTRRQERAVARSWRTRMVYGRLLARTVAISPAVAACLRRGGLADPLVIASSVDPEALRPQRAREVVRAELGLAAEDFAILTLAALVPRKGVDLLLGALAVLRRGPGRAVLLVAGEGPARGELERLAQTLGLAEHVRFLGQRADKAELLAACDVFALASRAEGLGVAALEAMAAGRAVVASHVGGLAEAVLEGETGLLVAPGDVDGFARALARLSDEPALRARLGAAGPARVAAGHAAEQMVSAYERLYREVLCA
jgi:glycosyltransferase involved in cell wall biosynthesis